MSKKIRNGTTSSLPFGFGETFQTRTDSDGNRGVGRTRERAQKDLEKKQGSKKG